jgi:hypothetical protein
VACGIRMIRFSWSGSCYCDCNFEELPALLPLIFMMGG